MDKIRQFFETINNFLGPYWDKFQSFFGKGWYIIYAGILLLLLILIIVGLIRVFIKIPKTFLFLIILIAGFCVASYFIIYKEAVTDIITYALVLKL